MLKLEQLKSTSRFKERRYKVCGSITVETGTSYIDSSVNNITHNGVPSYWSMFVQRSLDRINVTTRY